MTDIMKWMLIQQIYIMFTWKYVPYQMLKSWNENNSPKGG